MILPACSTRVDSEGNIPNSLRGAEWTLTVFYTRKNGLRVKIMHNGKLVENLSMEEAVHEEAVHEFLQERGVVLSEEASTSLSQCLEKAYRKQSEHVVDEL